MSSTPSVPGRTYADALEKLNLLVPNRAVTSLFEKKTTDDEAEDPNLRALPEMLDWLRRAGYTPSDLAALRCIHVAGTKGKGSVCAYLTSMLAASPSAGKVGTYTSPHLVSPRERIAIDGVPLAPAVFARYFFEIWDRFTAAAIDGGKDEATAEGPTTKPFFFRFMTVLAFHVFISEGVRSAVIEVGIGGAYDATNVLPKEAVTAAVVTQLGIDHVAMLGDTREKIAWHKAGIIKEGRPVFTRLAEEQPGVMAVLRERAEELGASELVAVKDWDVRCWGGVEGLKKSFPSQQAGTSPTPEQASAIRMLIANGINPTELTPMQFDNFAALSPVLRDLMMAQRNRDMKRRANARQSHTAQEERSTRASFQCQNQALAALAAEAHLAALDNRTPVRSLFDIPTTLVRTMEKTSMRGRQEVLRDARGVRWLLDGAHTTDSLAETARWLAAQVAGSFATKVVLLFNQQERDASRLLEDFLAEVRRVGGPQFDVAIFSRNDMTAAEAVPETELTVQTACRDTFAAAFPGVQALVVPDLIDAVARVTAIEAALQVIGAETAVLVTGSMHLVGNLIRVLEPESDE